MSTLGLTPVAAFVLRGLRTTRNCGWPRPSPPAPNPTASTTSYRSTPRSTCSKRGASLKRCAARDRGSREQPCEWPPDLGGGPLSNVEADGPGLEIGYERYLRLGGPVELEVRPEAGRGTTEIVVDDAYLEGFDLQAVTPQPDSADGRGVILTFEDGRPPR
jgi:hypothetical protein